MIEKTIQSTVWLTLMVLIKFLSKFAKSLTDILFMKVAIIGHGFVGRAVDFGFQKNIEKFIIDPILNNSILDLKDVDLDFIFVCVPTPMLPDGNQDNSILLSVFEI